MAQNENRWAGRAAAPYVIGVDLGGTNIRAALTDREGQILKEARRPALSEQAPDATLANIRDAVAEILEAQGAAPKEVVGIGIGVWITALNVKYLDFRYVIPFIVQMGLYVSPVGFSSNVIPD